MSKKISQLTTLSSPNVAAQIPVAYAGVTYAATIAVLTGVYTPTAAADQRAALQAAIDAVHGIGRGELTIAAGTVYLTSGGLTVYDGFRLILVQSTIVDFSGCANDTCCISGSGTEAAGLALTANAAKGATSVTVADASSLSQGDWIRVYSNTVFDASSTNSKIGEFVQVASTSGGTTVNLETPLRGGTYTTAASAAISKITPIKNVLIQGGTIRGGGTVTTAGSDKDHRGVQLFLADNCRVIGTRFERTDLVGVWFQDALFSGVAECYFKDFVNDQQAYGVLFDNSCQDCWMDRCKADRVRHIQTTGNSTAPGNTKGIARRITFSNLKCYSTTPARGGGGGDAFDTHTAAEDLKFINCISYSSTGNGFNIECASCTLDNCESYYATNASFVLHNESDQEGAFKLSNCLSVRAAQEGFRLTYPTRGATASIRSAEFENCRVEDSVGISFYVANTINTTALRNVTLKACKAIGCQNANASVWVQNVTTVDMDVMVSEPTQTGANLVRIRDCANVMLSGSLRHIDSSNNAICVYINATGAGSCTKVTVDGLRAGGVTPTNLRGVFADTNATNCTIGVVDLQECNTPLDLQSGTGHRIHQRPGQSSDNGDTSPTLTVNSAPTQRFNTALTANRTVTAPTASLAAGLKFRIVRESGATGAFNLTVFGGKVLATAGTWVDYECDGSGYRETGSGSL